MSKIIYRENYQYIVDPLENLLVDFSTFTDYVLCNGAHEKQISNLLKSTQLVLEERDCLLYSKRSVYIRISTSILKEKSILPVPMGHICSIQSLSFFNMEEEPVEITEENWHKYISIMDHSTLRINGSILNKTQMTIKYLAMSHSTEKVRMKIVQLTRDKIDSNLFYPI